MPSATTSKLRLCDMAMIAVTIALAGIAADVADERSVDLQSIERKAFQIAQARMTRAEIIDRQCHAHTLDLDQLGDHCLSVGHHRRLGDLELEPFRRQTRLGENRRKLSRSCSGAPEPPIG